MAKEGRPTLYTKETPEKADWYIEHYEKLNQRVPTAAGLALHLGVSKAVIYDWAKVHPKFLDMLGKLNAVQEEKLIQCGLGNEYNAAITKLMLAKHGYSERQEVDHTVKTDGPLATIYLPDNGRGDA